MVASPRGRLFCFGLGYTALALCEALRGSGLALAGTTRDPEKVARAQSLGIDAVPFDGTAPVEASHLDGVTHVLVSIPPGPGGDVVLAHHRAHLLAALGAEPSLCWVGYLSTTGVYGNRDGGWVDEGSALRPTSERARRRAEAERAWLALALDGGLPVHVFRLAGIYGPHRSVFDQLRAETARRIVRPGHRFSRIHVDDIVSVLTASMAHPRPGAVYNVCDDEPAEPAEVIAHAASLLGVPPPPEVALADAGLSAMARSFWADNKRVRNARIKKELGVALRHPTYREGLAAILAAES